MILPLIDIEASLAVVESQVHDDMIKLPEDLRRYERVIATDQPDVVVECGTFRGGSARWFHALGLDVVTIDIKSHPDATGDEITWVVGSSIDPVIVKLVTGIVAGKRTMVVLDSDHSAKHVEAEIRAYAGLVTPGCHLVVEDGICRWMGWPNSPMDAIESLLGPDPDFERDESTESMFPVSMYPCGWWVRR